MPLFAADVPPSHQIAAEFAFDRTFVVGARYDRGLADVLGPVDAQVGVHATVPLFATQGLSDWALGAHGAALWPLAGPLAVELQLGTSLARARDARGRMLAWSGQLAARPGWVGQRARLTLDMALQPTLATHVRHASWIDDTFADRYPDGRDPGGPQDGWYRGTAGRVVLGLCGAYLAPGGIFVSAGGGWSRSLGPLASFPDVGVLPFTTHVRGGLRW